MLISRLGQGDRILFSCLMSYAAGKVPKVNSLADKCPGTETASVSSIQFPLKKSSFPQSERRYI